MDKKILSHFSIYKLTQEFWNQPKNDKKQLFSKMMTEQSKISEKLWHYQIFPFRKDGDFMLWHTIEVKNTTVPHKFASDFAKYTSEFRQFIEPVQALWGMTKPSMYSKRKTVSDQEMDPYAEKRQPYLVAYPFTKNAEWYLKSRETRQGMMNEHIRIGREFPQITQLLLYSVGLQDDEFVVVYETEDLALFSDLVYQLRSTEARAYTHNDVPIITGGFHNAEDLSELFCR